MKALLILFFMIEGRVFVQPMPTMQGCLEAKSVVDQETQRLGRTERAVTAVCVVRK